MQRLCQKRLKPFFNKPNAFYSTSTEYSPTTTANNQITQKYEKFGLYLSQCLPKYITSFSVWKDELTIKIPKEAVIPTFTFLRDNTACSFKQVIDVCGVDYPERVLEGRFDVVYHLLSVQWNIRLRVKVATGELDPGNTIFAILGYYI